MQKTSLVDLAIAALKTRIDRGDWPIGGRIPTEPELAERLGMSRNTVREAVRVLNFAGVLEVRQGDGTYLRTRSNPLDTVKTLARCAPDQRREVRELLETQAMRLAAQRRTDDDIAELEVALDAAQAVSYRDEPERHADLDLAFHTRLVAAAHNPVLLELYQFFVMSHHRAELVDSFHNPALAQPGLAEHRALLDAVIAQDADAAAEACRVFVYWKG
ncbi:FadR/GntR family transcriptional regulator [Crenobacter cavernae]|uniref:FadR family transcriptional regulator n=1 Tax=Crenobacter cavernae TaxID=2290923 RepID=A0A345Y669_9NEIS|nr:FCD domain-containing protein [Crenobacter cavernae]AXK39421.1 FadR family transcriptional regulator [Crenobacter cavernae]